MINYVVSKCLGSNFFDAVQNNSKNLWKKYQKKISYKLKKILNGKYSTQIKQMIVFDIIFQNSTWEKCLWSELKKALLCLSRILHLFVKTVLDLLKSLIKDDTRENKHTNIFSNFSECRIDKLKSSLEDSLENAQLNVSNAIFILDDYLNKALKLPEKSKELMNILVDNKIVNWCGEINLKLINDNKFFNQKYSFKFPMEEVISGLNKAKKCHDNIISLSQVLYNNLKIKKMKLLLN